MDNKDKDIIGGEPGSSAGSKNSGEWKIDAVTSLITLAVLTVGTVFLYFLFRFVSNPFTRAMEEAGTITTAQLVWFRAGVGVLIYFVLTVIVVFKNPVERSRFINLESGRNTSYGREFVAYAKRCALIHALTAAAFALPIHIIAAVFPGIQYFMTTFLPVPQYSMILLAGNVWLSWLFNILIYTAVTLLLTPLCHVIWDRRRLHKQADKE